MLLKSDAPDAIIATGCKSCLAFFDEVRFAYDELRRPVLVVVTEQMLPDEHVFDAVDLVVPPVACFIEHQLQRFLRLRAKTAALLHENAALQNAIASSSLPPPRVQSAGELILLRNAIIHNVSHELRTPLLQLKSAVKLLTEDVGQSVLSGYALQATARLEGAVKNIMQLAEGLEVRREPMVVRDTIEFALRNLRRSWQHEPDLNRLEIHLETKLPVVEGDARAIGIALQLLADNALKFSQDAVEIAARRVEDGVLLQVRDYGIGIPEDKLEAIFEPFVQVDVSSTRRYHGIGVGLALVRLILEQHDARVDVKSRVGEGSTFGFLLPVV